MVLAALAPPSCAKVAAEYPLHKPRANTPGAGLFLSTDSTLCPMHSHTTTRVLKFTDTLADINGVCRFIQNAAQRAHDTNRNLQVFTSTRMPMPPVDHVRNFTPIFAMKMPGYETLDLALPPMIEMLKAAEDYRPTVIHISTPGPIGTVGMIAAKLMRLPVVGVYHTDFPAYIDDIFDNRIASFVCRTTMSVFYKQFAAVFSRSTDYAHRLESIGIDANKLVRLKPGYDNTKFDHTLRDQAIWQRNGIRQDSIKVIYCGRVSTDKNLAMLTEIWPTISRIAQEQNKPADLVIIGDGPYRSAMQSTLEKHNTHFLGFRNGTELATLYASSDLFIFPSTTDTLGQVVMESQASGLPVIITDQGGPKEVVTDQTTGIVLDPSNTQAWIDTALDLIFDDKRRTAMGAAGIEAMKSHTFAESFEHYWKIHQHI